MLRDAFMNALWSYGIIVITAVSLVILKACYRYLFRSGTSKPQPITAASSNQMGMGRVLVQPGEVAPEAYIVEDTRPMKATPSSPKDSIVRIELEPEAQAGTDEIECANCHHEIKSGCTEVKKQKGGPDILIYQCEHCGKNVAIQG